VVARQLGDDALGIVDHAADTATQAAATKWLSNRTKKLEDAKKQPIAAKSA